MVIEGPHIRMMEMTMEMTWMIYPTNPEITVSRQKQWMSRTSLANPWSQSKIGSFLCCFFFFFEVRFTLWKLTILALQFSGIHSVVQSPSLIPTFPSPQKRALHPWDSRFLSFPAPSPWQPQLLSVSMDLRICIFHIKGITIHNLLCLTLHVFEFHPCCSFYQHFILLHDSV